MANPTRKTRNLKFKYDPDNGSSRQNMNTAHSQLKMNRTRLKGRAEKAHLK
ncbi:hypothetical protein T08_13141 [Trichinella sp. T8]|nr:hypothetical protein T08_13141 [Trichinella sp. T8]